MIQTKSSPCKNHQNQESIKNIKILMKSLLVTDIYTYMLIKLLKWTFKIIVYIPNVYFSYGKILEKVTQLLYMKL